MKLKMEYDEHLYILQNIITVQGEGPNIGKPSLLIRLAGCNLRCSFCDTKWSWNIDIDDPYIRIVTKDDFNQYLEELNDLINLYNISNIMITGGEPLLYAKNPMFYNLLSYISSKLCYSFEIETNGLLLDDLDINKLENPVFGQTINISPKMYFMEYSDNDYQNMINIYRKFIEKLNGIDGGYRECVFKFVDTHDLKTRTLIENIIYDLDLDPTEVYIMPQTPDKPKSNYNKYLEKVTQLTHKTLEYCLNKGYILSPRLHLYLFKDQYEKIIK